MRSHSHYRILSLGLFLLLSTLPLAAQTSNIEGAWSGSIQIPGQQLDIMVTFKRAGDDWSGTIDIPLQKAKDLPLTGISAAGGTVRFTIAGVPGDPTFTGMLSLDGTAISGTMAQGGGSFPFSMRRVTAAEQQKSAMTTPAALDSLRAFIRSQMTTWRVPGLAIAVVRGDSILFAEGFGYRDNEKKLPVTPNTLFAIGSSTKAFTSLLIGTLVDEGKLEWDEPVITYLPEFRLYDPIATQQLTVRDLLTHTSGLPRHDLLWYGSTLTRRELFDRLQYLEPTAGLREQWQYQNLMYMTAGYLAERLTGKSWETLVRERIFEPLGMTGSNFSIDSIQRSTDFALPYEESAGALRRMAFRNIDQIGPAGSINSSVTDMARWVRLHLADGMFEKRKVIGSDLIEEIHAPQVVIGGAKTGDDELLFNLYAMGWVVHAYRGRQLLEHGGNIDGFSALVSFMPDDDIGLVILTNQNGSALPTLVMYTAYDLLLGFPKKDWSAVAATMQAAMERAESLRSEDDVTRVPNTKPSHALKAYAGEYEHPAYGVMNVKVEREKLTIAFRDISAPLEHFHYDVFRASTLPEPYTDLKVQFMANVDGDIDRLAIPLELSLDPIVFTRRAPSILSEPSYLRQFAGAYTLGSQQIEVKLEGNRLSLSVPGQPLYTLLPSREMEFTLKGLDGLRLLFEEEKGAIVRMISIQPNGTFVATRN